MARKKPEKEPQQNSPVSPLMVEGMDFDGFMERVVRVPPQRKKKARK